MTDNVDADSPKLSEDDVALIDECSKEFEARLESLVGEFVAHYGSKFTNPGIATYTLMLLLSRTIGRMLASAHPDNLADCESHVQLNIRQGKEYEELILRGREVMKVYPKQDQSQDPYGLAGMPIKGSA